MDSSLSEASASCMQIEYEQQILRRDFDVHQCDLSLFKWASHFVYIIASFSRKVELFM